LTLGGADGDVAHAAAVSITAPMINPTRVRIGVLLLCVF
jgi:hypothetical protein